MKYTMRNVFEIIKENSIDGDEREISESIAMA